MKRAWRENTVESTFTEILRFDYESKGRGFESRRAHYPEVLENQGFRGFLMSVSKCSKTQFLAVKRTPKP